MTIGIEAADQSSTTAGERAREGARRPRLQWTAPQLLLVAAVLASATVLLVLGSRLTFLFDDFDFLFFRPGWSIDTLLHPHNEHIVLIPLTIYKVLLAIFGMGSAFPFRVVSTLIFLTSAVLLFVYLRTRIDEWLALAGTIVILFLGAAYEDLLWSFQMAFFGSMAAGLGMLLALERRNRRGDRLACGLLTVSLGFSSLGISFAAAAAVEIATRADRWRRSYIVAIPGALFAIWWLHWGRTADHALTFHNFGLTPLFVVNAIANALPAMLGFSTPTPESAVALDWGRPIFVLVAAIAAWRIYKLGGVTRSFWIAGAAALSFWVLAGLFVIPGREATASRYIYISAIFILLLGSELVRGIRVSRTGRIVLAGAVSLIVISNVTLLHQGYKNYRSVGQVERGDLAVLDIMRGRVNPAFLVTPENGTLPFALTNAGPYFDAEERYDSTLAYSPAELTSAPEAVRVAADKLLAAGLGIKLSPAQGVKATGSAPQLKGPPGAELSSAPHCLTVRVTEVNSPLLLVPEGRVLLRSEGTGQAEVRLRRFAQQSIPVDLGKLRPGATALVSIPTDRSQVPWRMSLMGTGPVAVCGIGTQAGTAAQTTK